MELTPREKDKLLLFTAALVAERRLARGLKLDLDGTFSWSPSINEGEPISPADQSVGKQLPYEPEFSATVTGRLTWRSWGLLPRSDPRSGDGGGAGNDPGHSG